MNAHDDNTATTDSLAVTFMGERRLLTPADSLTFGRAGQMVIDNNPALHRLVGQFFYDTDAWWLRNLGRSIVLTVTDRDSPSLMRIAPGTAVQLSFAWFTILFDAGPANYEVEGVITGFAPMTPPKPRFADGADDHTTTPADLELTPEQRILLISLAESWLRTGGPIEQLPTNRQLATSLGWSPTKLNRKIDAVCRRFADAGVTGLVGSVDDLARDRRLRLTEYAVYTGIIDATDLALLDAFRSDSADDDNDSDVDANSASNTNDANDRARTRPTGGG